MAQACVQAAGGRVPVIPGVLDPGYYDAMQAAQEFAATGADAVMLLTPYYTRPTQAGPPKSMSDAFISCICATKPSTKSRSPSRRSASTSSRRAA